MTSASRPPASNSARALAEVVLVALLGQQLLARAFQLSGYRLLPVIVAHASINLVIEPALMLSYFSG